VIQGELIVLGRFEVPSTLREEPDTLSCLVQFRHSKPRLRSMLRDCRGLSSLSLTIIAISLCDGVHISLRPTVSRIAHVYSSLGM
jgi:hypothetical protein